jgi:aryl-alcohol dehydrogenase-like predicted oxidoreductase
MNSRAFGRTGLTVSEVGYGLWGMGGWTGSDDAESIAALHRSIELGCTFFDTALAYGDGKSEQLLGQVLPHHRDKNLIVATKVPPKNGKWPAKPEYALADVFPVDWVVKCTERSLTHLGVERIDVQQLHVWTDEWAEQDEWMDAIQTLKKSGKVRAFGISINRWDPTNIIEALRTGLVDSVQVVHNIFDQHPEDVLFPLCERWASPSSRACRSTKAASPAHSPRTPAGPKATSATTTSRQTNSRLPWIASNSSKPKCPRA